MWFPFLLTLAASCQATLDFHEPPPPASTSRNTPVEGWITVQRDHFNAADTDTFQMRYYFNDPFGGSDFILIFVGGEWSISPGWLTAGLTYELAEDLSAALFYTEHRYYGQTWPVNDTSVPNLRWLSVDQALADLAHFIQHVKSDQFQGGRFRAAKVGLVGCSYAGSMATWMRLAYPHLVDAAFSDSGPLLAQEDFPEYLEVITEALRSQGGQACVDSVQAGMEGVQALLQTTGGAAQVSQMFGTCSQLVPTNPLDLATFFWFGITESFAYLVQYATPGDIAGACVALTDTSIGTPVERLAAWTRRQPYTQPCIESRYSAQVEAHSNTSFTAPDSVMRLWTYQTCVEYGWYQTTSSPNQPFLNAVPLEYFHQMCKDFFSFEFDEALLRSGIARSNLLFGGLSRLPDRAVSVAGGADPWAPMGPSLAHARPLSPVYVVPDVSHCRAIQPSESSETDELARVKFEVKARMASYLQGSPLYGDLSAAPALRPTLLLAAAAVLHLYH